MTTAVNNRFEASFRTQLDKVVDLDGSQAQDRQINYQEVALTIGQGVNEAEKNALMAFSLPEDATSAEKESLGKRLGLAADKAKSATPEGLRQAANLVLARMRNLMEMFTNLLNAKKRTDDVVISNIRS